jgi:hypothetical protein
MTQDLQGVSGDSPLEASNALLSVAGCAAMVVGTAWLSRVSVDTSYLTGIALPMVVFGIGQGLGLSTLTTAGMAGVAPEDAGVAGGLVNVAHHTGGALGVGILATVFADAGAHGPRELLAQGVSASLIAATAFLLLALAVTLIAHPRSSRRHGALRGAAAG